LVSQKALLLHQFIGGLNGMINHGILIRELISTRDWTLDLGLNILYQFPGVTVHLSAPDSRFELSIPLSAFAEYPFHSSDTGRSQAGSAQVNPLALVKT
jgi:hypothetical protein